MIKFISSNQAEITAFVLFIFVCLYISMFTGLFGSRLNDRPKPQKNPKPYGSSLKDPNNV